MKDSDFKEMRHCLDDGMKIISSGLEVSHGYKPDLTIADQFDEIKFIMESEQKTDRKAFLGDLIKAEKYSQDESLNPVLIIVMKIYSNTTVKQISDHLEIYLQWMVEGFDTKSRINKVFIISDSEYVASAQANEKIGTEVFYGRGEIIEKVEVEDRLF